MSADYGYINARIKGMRSKLLAPTFYHGAVDSADFKTFVSSLAQSSYATDLDESQTGLRAVDRAIARNISRTTRSILNFSDGKPHDLIAVLLKRYDLANLKALARAKHADREAEEIVQQFFPAGELKPAHLEQAAAAPDMQSAAQIVALGKDPLAIEFLRVAKAYAGDGDLYQLELGLDHAFFSTVVADAKRAGASKGLLAHLALEIDATNLRTALKLRGSGSNPSLFIEGGSEIKPKTFETLLVSDDDGALQALAGTAFKRVADAASLSEAEAIIRSVLDEDARKLARDPLGIGVVLDFLRRKEQEAARLRLLARGKYYGVPKDAIVKELGDA